MGQRKILEPNMNWKICSSFDASGLLLLGVSTTSSFSEPETFLLDFLDEDLPNDIESGREEDSVSGDVLAAGFEDPVGRK
jgi:hypothetical protein